MATVVSDFVYDPFSIEAMTDPFPLYKRLRRDFPIYHLPQYHSQAFSRFEDVWQLFLDREHFTEAEGQSTMPREQLLEPFRGTPFTTAVTPLPLFNNMDPPLHGKVRRPLDKPLMSGAVKAYEDLIRGIVRARLDVLAEKGEIDANPDLISYVSAGAACHVAGLPQSVVPDVIPLVNAALRREPGKPGITEAGWQAIGTLNAMLVDLVAARRKGEIAGDPRMIDGLFAAQLPGRSTPLADEEVAQQLISIVIGGTESLPKVMSGGLIDLWRNPDQRREVAANVADHAPKAVEEIVRRHAPAQWFIRTLKEDAVILGQPMRKGERAMLLVASANHDEREFDDPDAFIWNRDIRRMVHFGMGLHFCIGLHIARLEARILLEELLTRFPDYVVAPERGERAMSDFQIGWVRLPIRVR